MLEYFDILPNENIITYNIAPIQKIELKRYKCNIVEILGKKNLVKIRLINHPFEVFYNLPSFFFDKIGFSLEKFYLICFDDYSIVLEKIIV